MNEYLISGSQGNYQILSEIKGYSLRSKSKNQLFSSMLAEKFFWFKATRKTIGTPRKLKEDEETFFVYTSPDKMRLSWLDTTLFHLVGAMFIWLALDFFLNLQIGLIDSKTFAEAYSAFFIENTLSANVTPSFLLALSFWAVPSSFLCALPSFGFFQTFKLFLGGLPHFGVDQTLGRIADQLFS